MINVPVPKKSYGVYVSAVRFIARRVGLAAPTPVVLIQHELAHRDPELIAHEYLGFLRTRRGAMRSRGKPVRAKAPRFPAKR